MHEFDVVILEDEIGGYLAFVPALQGCHTQGDTLDELIRNVRERNHRVILRDPDRKKKITWRNFRLTIKGVLDEDR